MQTESHRHAFTRLLCLTNRSAEERGNEKYSAAGRGGGGTVSKLFRPVIDLRFSLRLRAWSIAGCASIENEKESALCGIRLDRESDLRSVPLHQPALALTPSVTSHALMEH